MNFPKAILGIFVLMVIIVIIPHVRTEELEVDFSKILSGEVIVENSKNSGGLKGIRAMFAVSASRDQIWKALLDYDHYPEIFDGIIKVKVLEQDDNGANVEFWIDAVLKNLHYVLYRHYEKPGHRLTWKRVSGDLRRIEGSWLVLDTPRSGTKMLVYNSYIKLGGLGRLAPTWLIRRRARGKARSMGLKLRNWIEANRVPGGTGEQ